MRDIDTKVDNTAPAASGRLAAAQFNVIATELKALTTSSGISLDPANGPDTITDMLSDAVARYASGGLWAQDSGAANTYVLSRISGFQLPRALFAKQMIYWLPGATNTTASTANANATGVKPIVTHLGAALVGGEIVSGRVSAMYYDSTIGSGSWVIPPWANYLIIGVTGGGGASGEANTASNLGTGAGVWKDKSGVDLRFRSIEVAGGLARSIASDTIVIDATLLQSMPSVLFEHRMTAGVNGGAVIAGRTTRPLNTSVINSIGATLITGGSFTLPAGTYWFDAWGVHAHVDQHQEYLRNVTDGTDVLVGPSVQHGVTSEAVNPGRLTGYFTLGGTKTLRIEALCHKSSGDDTAFGTAVNGYLSGGVPYELYAAMAIWKTA